MGRKISKWISKEFRTIYGFLAFILIESYAIAALIAIILEETTGSFVLGYILLVAGLPSIIAFYLLGCKNNELILEKEVKG